MSRRLFLALTATVVGLVVNCNIAGADAQPSCSSSFDAYAVSASTLHACGITLSPAATHSSRSDGASVYDYRLGGTVASFVVPPRSFDAAHASAQELAAYGVPAEPPASEPREQQLWQEMVANLHWVTPPTQLAEIPVTVPRPTGPGLTSGPFTEGAAVEPPSEVEAGAFNSGNWSGYINTTNSQAYGQATGYYIEPSNHGSSCAEASEVTWAGLGGWNSGQLAQDGTGLATPGLGAHQAWWEILPAVTHVVPINLYATAGSEFLADVIHISGNQFEFYMYNYASGEGSTFYETDSGFDGSSAEYVVERPSVNGTLTKLLNFGSVAFEGYTNNKSLNNFGNSTLTMVDGGGGVMAYPGGLSGAKFTDYFKYCL